MPRTAPTPPGGPHSVIYVRVSPKTKQQLRDLADSRFDGNMAAAIRWLVDLAIDALPSPPPDG